MLTVSSRSIIPQSSCWRDSRVSVRSLQHMALDSVTGLDPEGVALRATEGLFGVDYFFPVRLPPQ